MTLELTFPNFIPAWSPRHWACAPTRAGCEEEGGHSVDSSLLLKHKEKLELKSSRAGAKTPDSRKGPFPLLLLERTRRTPAVPASPEPQDPAVCSGSEANMT